MDEFDGMGGSYEIDKKGKRVLVSRTSETLVSEPLPEVVLTKQPVQPVQTQTEE
jgi:hypothetical protein